MAEEFDRGEESPLSDDRIIGFIETEFDGELHPFEQEHISDSPFCGPYAEGPAGTFDLCNDWNAICRSLWLGESVTGGVFYPGLAEGDVDAARHWLEYQSEELGLECRNRGIHPTALFDLAGCVRFAEQRHWDAATAVVRVLRKLLRGEIERDSRSPEDGEGKAKGDANTSNLYPDGIKYAELRKALDADYKTMRRMLEDAGVRLNEEKERYRTLSQSETLEILRTVSGQGDHFAKKASGLLAKNKVG